jgi:hypothetical protein
MQSFFAIMLAGVLCGTVGLVAGAALPVGRGWQREAILKGHAIWAVDKDGGPVFQWKPIGGER